MTAEEMEAKIRSLEEKLKSYEKRLQLLEDIEAIKRLQKAYNYYVEHMMGQEIIDCFADSPDVCLDWLEGKYLGKEGVRRYFARAAKGENPPGFSHQLMPIAGLITVDPDGRTAKGRWYAFGGVFMAKDGKVDAGSLVSGLYEMTYIKEDGIWKILAIKWFIPYSITIKEGWVMPEETARRIINWEAPGQKLPPMPAPDIPIDLSVLRYVSGYIFPMHFVHPVTGRPSTEASRNARLKPMGKAGGH
ncbi:MAG: nuclear transport factor 2 family protein [Dehalococcoidales bacterium]|nr:nuclear transport factor 2 family protein [Dehalococcoidales bacterium]